MKFLQQPNYRHVFYLRDGGVIYAVPNDVVKTLDKRFILSQPERVFEVKVNGMWRKLWPSDIAKWDQEPV